jgi:hypothetical protein
MWPGTPNTTPTPRRSSNATGPASPTSTTSPPSTGTRLNPSTSSPPATRASRFPTPADVKEKPMPATSGPTSPPPFARYDPASCCWKTCSDTSLWDLELSSVTWPRRGSMRNGSCYERPMSAPPTDGRASLSLLPTPRTSDTNGAGQHGTGGQDLRTAIALLPTPAAHDSGNSPEAHLRKKPGREQVTSLQVIVDHGLLSSGGRIPPPSDAGNESSDGQPPGQQTLL